MDYAKPADVIAAMVDAGEKKLALDPRDLLIRGAISGALLGAATSLAFSGAITTGQPLVGAIIFPVSLVMIVLLGLELVTGSFGLLPLARLEGKAGWSAIGATVRCRSSTKSAMTPTRPGFRHGSVFRCPRRARRRLRPGAAR